MNLVRIGTWVIVLTAAVMAGPNGPAQMLGAARGIMGTAKCLFKRRA